MTHNTDTERAELCSIINKHLSEWTKNMENYSYFGKNPGVSEDDYEEIAAAIASEIQEARRAPAVPVPQDAEILRSAISRCADFIENADVSSGVCCCGDSMDGHSDPMVSGHVAVDEWDWSAACIVKELRAMLAAAPQPPEAAPVQMPEYGIDTANHAGIRVRGYTEQQVRELLAAQASVSNGTLPSQPTFKTEYGEKALDPLTDEQINDLRQKHGVTSAGRGIKEFTNVCDFARAIERAHGIGGAA